MNGTIINTVWTLLCAFFVILMQAGFAMTTTGFTRAKNAGHSMAMGMMIPFIAALGYWAAGYAVQAGGRGFFLSDVPDSALVSFLFQAAVMSIAAAIPAGAMAERWAFKSFVVYGFFMSLFTYPLYAHWVWGGGWLSRLGVMSGLGHGVVDFAGSAVVHMTGGVAGLAGAVVLGPRTGKYRASGAPVAIPGHHIPMAMLGCLVLFFGWFGFNAGPALAGGDARMGLIALNTLLSGAAASFAALCYMWFLYGKPDLSLAANGLLAGLVAISASCAFVGPGGALLIGLVAGLLCCLSVFFVERRLRVDDPAGAVSVHGAAGVWGMIGLGLFADGTSGEGVNGVAGAVRGLFYGGGTQLAAQAAGVVVNFVFVFGVMYLFFKALNAIMPLRVAEETEFEGLDQNEVSVTAYPDFSITKTRR